MASHSVLMIFALIVPIVPMTTLATEYIVGDESGWTLGFDYHAWAADKNFLVGDKLVFNYPVGVHNVFKVNGTEFQNCIIPAPEKALSSGNDTIVLATPGKKWYICGVGKHCELGGQKLTITVQSLAPTPSPAPSPLYAKPYEPVKSLAPTPSPAPSPLYAKPYEPVKSLAPTPSPAPSPYYAKTYESVKAKRPFVSLPW